MSWIRRAHEAPERRPIDLVRLVVGGFGVVLLGMWAQTQTTVNANLFEVVNDLPNSFEDAANWLYALGSIWAVAAITLITAVFAIRTTHHWRLTVTVALGGAGAWLIANGLNDLLGDHPIKEISIQLREGSLPTYPSANVAVATALAVLLSPYVVRQLRRVFLLVVVGVTLAAMYLGTAFPSDALGGLLLGTAVAGLVLAAFGAPGGRPSIDEVRDALGELGFDVEDVQHAKEQVPRAAAMDVVLASGEHVRAEAFGRDQRDGQFWARLWHWIMYREPGETVVGTRAQRVEHIGFAVMLTERAGVPAPRLLKTGVAGADSAMLVTTVVDGTPLVEIDPDQVTDATLRAVWKPVLQLHEAGVSHGNLDASHLLVAESGTVLLDDLSKADACDEQYWFNRDAAAVLVATSSIVGNERAITAAVEALGKDGATEIIPVVQPAALPNGITKGQKHFAKTLKELRTELATAVGAEDTPPLKIQRLSLLNIGMLVGILFALAIAISSMQGINFESVKVEFENAIWGYAVIAVIIYPFVTMSWATALMGAVKKDLPFVPTVITQLACSLLNLITPNGIGGTALQIDYLHKQDVPIASAGSAMVLSTGVGGAMQMLLFLAACAFTSTDMNLFDTGGDSSGSSTLLVIAVVGALVGIILAIPKIRNKVVPAVKQAAADIWAVLRSPKKALQLFGGDTMGNLLYPAILGLCLLAFGQSLPFAELMVVQIGAGMLGGAAPVPGGIGVYQAALTSLLTGFGIPAAAALAAALLFRLITFAIPPFFGYFALRWLRGKGYA
jgi:uncharacterized membrane protein YbhN (UPF0104 family)/membrane-associated phospholipid phosphatase